MGMAPPIVTRVREAGEGRVAVELDGSPWRVMPVEAAARSGLDVGITVDRARARRLRVELRRAEALTVAARALRHRDHSRQSLAERLADRRIDVDAGEEALKTLERLGLVDDRRAAHARARALAERDAGDAYIRADLMRRGFAADAVAEALAALEPESDRLARVVERRGLSDRALRRLASKGFPGGLIEELVATLQPDELG
jgi:SOS response regulatory protein OraA/RecX